MAEGKIRIKDIAKIAGVSATTVSNVIHGRTEKVSRKTRKRIEEILDEQEYAPSMGARILLEIFRDDCCSCWKKAGMGAGE